MILFDVEELRFVKKYNLNEKVIIKKMLPLHLIFWPPNVMDSYKFNAPCKL